MEIALLDSTTAKRPAFIIPLRWYFCLPALVAVALAFEWWLEPSDPKNPPFGRLLFIEVATLYVWALLGVILWRFVRRFPLTRPHVGRDLAAHCLMALAIVIAHLGRYLAIVWVNAPPHALTLFVTGKIAQYFVRGQAISHLAIYAAIVLFLRATWLREVAKDEALVAARQGAELALATASNLKAQLHPHFLFNILNSISSLMHTDVRAADEMLEQTAQFLRESLEMGREDQVSLTKELAFAAKYLQLQKRRFADSLQYRILVQPDAMGYLVPSLLLQPLVENAVVHGVAKSGEPGEVLIRAESQNGDLHLWIANECCATNHAATEGTGLRNTRRRLQLIYGNKARLEFACEQSKALVTVHLPASREDRR